MLLTSKLLINGEEKSCVSGKQIALVDPSTEKEWFKVDEADKEDVEIAVKHAEAAWPAWAATSAGVKAAALRKLGELVMANSQELAEVECKTMGKPITHIKTGDIPFIIGFLNYFASLVETAQSTVSTNTPGHLNYTLQQPFGVTAGILPWNVPMLMFVWKIGPAVGAGNAIIIKPSEKAPLTPLMLGKLALEAGFPPGLIQVLPGYGPTVGAALALHMKIRRISFTGSLAVGKLIQQMAGQSNLKSVTLELGGKSPAIIFPDADLPSAARQLAASILRTSGQSCMATSRVYVHSSVVHDFLDLYKEAFEKNTKVIGNARDEKTMHGPQVDHVQHEKIKKYLEIGKEEGGKVFLGGAAVDREGFFIQPTIFTQVDDSSVIIREEIFGPVSIVNTFETEEEIVTRANDTEYGLYASVFTKNIDRAMRIAKAFEAGSVGVNCCSPTISANMPFGGYKQSGMGRELGPNALDSWKQTKSVFVKLD